MDLFSSFCDVLCFSREKKKEACFYPFKVVIWFVFLTFSSLYFSHRHRSRECAQLYVKGLHMCGAPALVPLSNRRMLLYGLNIITHIYMNSFICAHAIYMHSSLAHTPTMLFDVVKGSVLKGLHICGAPALIPLSNRRMLLYGFVIKH